jgi:hypothetical protein
LLQTQIALELINPMVMRMHEVALDGTCGQSGSEIHEKEPKTVCKFLLFITHPCKAGGRDQVPWQSGLSQAYYTISRWGGVTIMTACLHEGTVSAITLKK